MPEKKHHGYHFDDEQNSNKFKKSLQKKYQEEVDINEDEYSEIFEKFDIQRFLKYT